MRPNCNNLQHPFSCDMCVCVCCDVFRMPVFTQLKCVKTLNVGLYAAKRVEKSALLHHVESHDNFAQHNLSVFMHLDRLPKGNEHVINFHHIFWVVCARRYEPSVCARIRLDTPNFTH